MKNLISFFLVLLLIPINSYSAIKPPPYTGGMNNAIGLATQQNINKKLGLLNRDMYFDAAGNFKYGADPTYKQKMSQVYSGLATGLKNNAGKIAVGVGGIAATGLAGISFAQIAVLSIAGYGISKALDLAIDAGTDWYYGDEENSGLVKVESQTIGADPSQFATMPSSFTTITDKYEAPADVWFRTNLVATPFRHFKLVKVVCPQMPYCSSNSINTSLAVDETFKTIVQTTAPNHWRYRYSIVTQIDPLDSFKKTHEVVMEEVKTTQKLVPPLSQEFMNLTQAMNKLEESMLKLQLTDEMLAETLTRVLAQRQPIGDPIYDPDPSNPVTASDIAELRSKYPEQMPTVEDLFSPVAPPGVDFVPIPEPGVESAPINPDAIPKETVTKIDFGTFTAPTLEPTPTTNQILDPIFNLFPQWLTYQMPSHSSECPVIHKDTVFRNYTIPFDTSVFCQLTTENYNWLNAAFIFGWILMAFFIVLEA